MTDTGLLRQPVEGALFLCQYFIKPGHNHNREVIFTISKLYCRLGIYSLLETYSSFVGLQLTLSMRHDGCGYSFSRASTVMRPAHKSISADVWKFESRLVSHFEAALLRASEPGPSTATVSPKPIRFAASFSFPTRGRVYLYVYKTLCWKPCFPNHQSGARAVVWSGRHGSICQRRGRPRHWTLERLCLRGNVQRGRSYFSD